MPKEFYSERDIEDMVKRGILSLTLNDNVVLTELAREKANSLGMQLVRDKPEIPPGAPVRPYLSQQPTASGSQSSPPKQSGGADIRQRIRSAVAAQLGNQVDPDLLDTIITRVLQSTGIK